MNSDRCPYYSLDVAKAIVPGHYSPMRLPVYRCALSETIIERLQVHPVGRRLADALQTIAADDIARPQSGPDFKPLHPLTCTVRRFQECKAHFTEHLKAYDQEVSLPAQQPREHTRRMRP